MMDHTRVWFLQTQENTFQHVCFRHVVVRLVKMIALTKNDGSSNLEYITSQVSNVKVVYHTYFLTCGCADWGSSPDFAFIDKYSKTNMHIRNFWHSC